ncbi:MAG: hypothetical protein PHG71_03585, partial [Kiritimatiellae bacterium]|nr:hypothetical protein [Kiritimatiellia bacterium]
AVNKLADAVKRGFVPTADMLRQAQTAYELCKAKLADLIKVGASRQVIEITEKRVKVAAESMKVIAEAGLRNE